jgi:outer membrane protein assembly factor BamB
MGQVFLGYSPAGRAVAVKVIHRQLAADPEFRTRFRREVAAARAVSGAYTAPVTAAGPDDDPPWLATVFVPGPSLAEAVAAAGPFPAVSVWKLAAGLIEALQAVHSCGLVHRDLKPANVLLALDGPRVIDFGISRALEKTMVTTTGMVVGTPSYMSPEQAQGARVGPPSDVFSLGCVIVFAATGRGPFGGGPQASMLYRVVHAEPALDEVPGGLRQLAAACLAKAPAGRPGLADLVEAAAAGRAPDEGDALASFWPVPVTGLIRSHQARLTTEMRERTAAPQPEPGTTGPQTTGPQTTGPDTSQAGVTGVPGPDAASAAGHVTPAAAGAVIELDDPPGPTVWPTVLATAPAGPVPAVEPMPAAGLAPDGGPAMPADRVAAGPPTGPAERGLTRRRALIGLAVVAGAGLAGAAWELTRGGSPQAAGGQPGQSPRPASRPSASGSAAAQRAGAALWSFATSGTVTGIALAPGSVFAGSADGRVYALRASDGTRRWDFPTGGPVQSRIAAAGGRVYAGSNDGRVYALRAGDGGKAWAFRTGGPVESTIAVAGRAVYAASEDATLYALSASDGSRLWGAPVNGVAGIAVAGGTVFACGADQVYALRASDGAPLWSSPTGAGGATGIAVAGGVVYAGSNDNRVLALRASDGKSLWDFPAGGSVQSGIAAAGGMVCAGSNDERVFAIRASDGKQLWHSPTNGSVTSGIALAGGIVYAGGNDYLVRALRASDGRQLLSFTADGPVESQIAVAGGIAYFGSEQVYALKGPPT